MFMYFKCFISIYMCDLSSYDYVWGIINSDMVLLRFFFKKKEERAGKKEERVGQKKRKTKLKRGGRYLSREIKGVGLCCFLPQTPAPTHDIRERRGERKRRRRRRRRRKKKKEKKIKILILKSI